MKFTTTFLILSALFLLSLCTTYHHKKSSLKKSHHNSLSKHRKLQKTSKKKLLQDTPADAAPADAAAGDAAAGDAAADDKSKEEKGKETADEVLENNDFEIEKCNQVIKATDNYLERGDMVFMANVYTLSIFSKADAGSLVTSVDFTHVKSELKDLKGAPECLRISAPAEKKTLVPCFLSLENKKDFKKAFRKLEKCREGIDISKEGDEDGECGEDEEEEGGEEKKDKEGAEEAAE